MGSLIRDRLPTASIAVSGDLRLFFWHHSPLKLTFHIEPLRKTKFNTTDALLALKEGREEGLQYFFDNYYSCLQFFAQKIIQRRSDDRNGAQLANVAPARRHGSTQHIGSQH